MDTEAELLEITQTLLDCIARGDWAMYKDFCDPTLTAFEPEAHGALVEGLQFHYFNLDMADRPKRQQTTVIAPKVRLMGNAAVVAYVRINQCVTDDGRIISQTFAETRVWERQGENWRHVHFHRTALS